ncbi:MAG: hypothetical protein L6V93_02465 [Clostridiales bacterium]|nr:MAG: hypothetical protein L6V93_02465 [Clostridiales bacterium]
MRKIAFPYLMLIQMIPILGMAPIINALTGDINKKQNYNRGDFNVFIPLRQTRWRGLNRL